MTKLRIATIAMAAMVMLGCGAHRVTHENLYATLWTQTAGEYAAITEQTFFLAELQLREALADPGWTAALEQDAGALAGLPPAIILDVDETVLDNSPYQAQLILENADYTPESWKMWVADRSADVLPGAKNFLEFARSQKVEVFYVTNRDVGLEADTRANLSNHGLPLSEERDVVLMKNENGWDSDKSSRREEVAKTHRILLLLGDDLNDFVSGARTDNPAVRLELAEKHAAMWGNKWLVLPNPQYGSWEASLFGRQYGLPDREKLRLKYGHLKGFKP